jgi:phosphoribosylanthranilate isomerase
MIIDGLVQVAGIKSLEEGRMLLDCGVDLLGFPLRLPVHEPDTSEAQARAIIEALGPAVCVLITYEDDPGRLVDLCRFLNVGTVQIHGDVAPRRLALIRARYPCVSSRAMSSAGSPWSRRISCRPMPRCATPSSPIPSTPPPGPAERRARFMTGA